MNARDKALELMEAGYITPEDLVSCCLKYMNTDDVADMLETNGLTEEGEEEDEEEGA